MNRAWIPAGALAGVSVAGLLALGPLTDSLGTQVQFPTTVRATPAPAQPAVVPVSVNLGTKGTLQTEPASLHGGQAVALPDANPDTGQVGFRRTTGSNQSGSSSSSAGSSSGGSTATTTQAPPAKPKAPKRQTTITATGESNGDAGLAGGSSGSSGLGEQSGTPGG